MVNVFFTECDMVFKISQTVGDKVVKDILINYTVFIIQISSSPCEL